MEETKVCSNPDCKHAGVPQPLSNFSHRAASKDKKQYRCKSCDKQRNDVLRENMPDLHREQSRIGMRRHRAITKLQEEHGISRDAARALYYKQLSAV